MSKSGNIEILRDDVEWMMQGLDFIREAAIYHANPQDPTMEEWEPVFDAADDIRRMLDDKMEAKK
jgi:hypothetical protein